ncbi:MAG: hypothetical protein ACRDRW_15910 [Pseudonocardiaceae bacterium]
MSAPTAAPALDRRNFWFAPSGRKVACLAGDGDSRFWAETWDLDGSPTWRPIPGDTGESGYTQPLQRDDGQVLLARPVNGQHHVVLCPVDGARRTLATVDALGLRLILSRTPDVLAYAMITFSYSECELWRVRDEEPALTLVVRMPGPVPSNEWLDAEGRTLGFSCLVDGEIRPLMVNTVTGGITASRAWRSACGRCSTRRRRGYWWSVAAPGSSGGPGTVTTSRWSSPPRCVVTGTATSGRWRPTPPGGDCCCWSRNPPDHAS